MRGILRDCSQQIPVGGTSCAGSYAVGPPSTVQELSSAPPVKAADENGGSQDSSMRNVSEGIRRTRQPGEPGEAGAQAAAALIDFAENFDEARENGASLVEATLAGAGLIAVGTIRAKPPGGSKPIDQTDWSGQHREIKNGAGAGAATSTRIDRGGNLWVQGSGGKWEHRGPVSDYTAAGRPLGRKGIARDQRRQQRRGRRGR